jgi:hypothetical protein
LTIADIVRDVTAYLGRPGQLALPYRDLVRIVARKVSEIALELLNTDRGYSASVVRVSPASRDVAISVPGVLVRLESRASGSTSDDEWVEWEEADYGDWNSVLATRGRSFAVYGTPPRLALSADPAGLEFRALVESEGLRLTDLADRVTMGEVVRPLLFNRSALEAGSSVNDATPEWDKRWLRMERHLLRERGPLEKAYKRHVEGRRDRGTRYREPFNSRRDSDPVVYEDPSGFLRAT